MSTPKPPLKFSPSGHRYWLNGRPCPGVTTLLSKGLPKPAIPYWAARTVAEYVADNPAAIELLWNGPRSVMVGALKESPWAKRDQAAVRGTAVHALAERVIHGLDVEVPEHLADHVDGYIAWLELFDVQPVLTERPVASEKHWYAGTFDGVVTFGRGPWQGMTVLADIKTSSGVYGETGLQTAAYALADWYLNDDGIATPIPYIEATGVAHVTDAGTQFYPLAKDRDNLVAMHKVFQHVAWIAKKTEDIKGYVGQPMVLEEEEAIA
jgi:hypothetical protein